MNELLLQMGLSNALLSLGLALLAVIVDKTTRRPHLAHVLWLLVLVKLVTPPVVTIPIVTIPELHDRTVVSVTDHSQATSTISRTEGDVHHSTETWSTVWDHGKKKLSLLWLLGSLIVLAVSLVRVYRFNGLLREGSEAAPQEYQTIAAHIANRLGLKTVPIIYTISTHLSPMVWWIGGSVRVVIPVTLLDQMSARNLQLILAHELAHVRRRDYLVRWIEWLACIFFWWNPVVWWARYNLRANEELCCDALVISSLKLNTKTYADSLLKAVECLACPVIRPPAIASEINNGGFLKRRFKMIVSKTLNRSNSRWLHVCVLLLAVAILPLGVIFAKESNNKTEAYLEKVWEKLQAVVKTGNFTAEEAETMMNNVKKIYAEYRAIEASTHAPVEADEITGYQDLSPFFERLKNFKAILRGNRDVSIVGYFNCVGGSTETFDRIRIALNENGFEGKQIEHALFWIIRVVQEMNSEEKEFELNPRLQDYLQKDFTDEQIELIIELAHRFARDLKEESFSYFRRKLVEWLIKD